MRDVLAADGKLDDLAIVRTLLCVDLHDGDLHIGKGARHIGDQGDACVGEDAEHCLIEIGGGRDIIFPGGADPAVTVLLALLPCDGVRAVTLVDGDTVALGDEADDIVARQGVTALGALDHAACRAVDDDATVVFEVLRLFVFSFYFYRFSVFSRILLLPLHGFFLPMHQ